jgi:ribulose-bisphosphate carboxylase large chain
MSFFLSGERVTVDYRLRGTETSTRAIADRLCVDQTIEAPRELLEQCDIPQGLIGTVEEFVHHRDGHATTLISFPIELLGHSFPYALHTVFGTASLSRGIRVQELHISNQLPDGWPGPRHGIAGLRKLAGIYHRPLVCAVLKPLGLSPEALAALARHFALGGVDMIKEDQGLGDHRFCPFKQRVPRCVEAIRSAAQSTGRRCLYMPHIMGAPRQIPELVQYAMQAGADGLLLSPGLIGYSTLHEIASDPDVGIPILSHPACLGTYAADPDSGLAPRVLYAQFPRLAGADVSIFPTYGLNFPLTQADCRDIGSACTQPWGGMKPIFPTAAGRMGEHRIAEMLAMAGRDVIFILGSQVRLDPVGVSGASQRFMATLEHLAR